jgi:hypothetical protein
MMAGSVAGGCRYVLWGVFLCGFVQAQPSPDLREVLARLDRLEAQNQQLLTEIRSLREQLAASPVVSSGESPAAAQVAGERLEVAERRIAELDQVKLGAENRLPVTLTGMLLFNSYWNGKASAGAQYPLVVPASGRRSGAGATYRQSILGLRMDGPTLGGGGKVTGSVFMDFFGGGTGLDQRIRLRVATLEASWKNTTVGVAFDKPIIAPRDPDSLAQVAISPLTGAGNLWLWQPQARVEHRVSFTEQAGLRLQTGVYQTAEGGGGVDDYYADTLALARPGYQGRFEFWGESGTRRIEIAPGFHASSTRVAGQSVPSRIFAIDWLIRPAARIDLTGTFFQGSNVGIIGGLRQGISFLNGRPRAVHATGGWAQLKIRATSRASVNLFGGQEDDRDTDLPRGAVGKNQAYGGNVIYRWGSNFLTSFEASQVRTNYLGSGNRINPHYDLAFGYLF